MNIHNYSQVIEYVNSTTSIKNTPNNNLAKIRQLLEKEIENKKIMYGITTGFGAFKNKFISSGETKKLQENLIVSHAVGQGDPFDAPTVKAIMLIITNYLSKGYSGVRPIVISTLLEMIQKEVVPFVPEKGSVGSSGDLAPSAHIILVLIGKGQAYFQGKLMPGKMAMQKARIRPLVLEAKEGLALINFALNTAAGASWVSFHNGGGVGIGNSLHAGMVIVADGTKQREKRLERVLTVDPGIGVARHMDAGYERAIKTAKKKKIIIPK